MRVIFFSYGALEQGGGFENFLIRASSRMQTDHPDSEVIILTSNKRLTIILQRLLSIYFMKWINPKQVFRENVVDIKKRLGSVNYIQADSIRGIRKILKSADIIHTKNELIELGLLGFFGFKKLPPIVTGIHTPIIYPYRKSFQSNLHNSLYRLVYSMVLKRLKAVYVQNQADYDFIANIRSFKGNLVKINQGVVFDSKKTKINDEKKLRVLFVGRFTEQKGIDILIEIINHINRNGKQDNYRFKIAGGGDEDLIKLVQNLELKYNNVEYLGHVGNNTIKKDYDWADCIIVPSRYETLCMVAIEAGLSGKIVIASNIPGPDESIINGKTGYLVNLDIDSFIAKLSELHSMKMSEPERLRHIGLKAKEHLTEKFSMDKAVTELYNLIFTAKAQ